MHVWIVEAWCKLDKTWNLDDRWFPTRDGAREWMRRRYWNTLTRVRKYERVERNSSELPKGSE